VMNAGRVQQVGTPQELYRQPANRFVASFVGRGNFLSGRPAADLKSFVAASGVTIACHRLQGNDDTLLVRPENVVVRRDRAEGANAFEAVIEAATFLGSAFELHLRLAGGDLLAADVPGSRAAGATDWAAGDSVTAIIDPGAAIGLRSGSEELQPDLSAGAKGAKP
jgi:putative spermidine/putrescine transport system ATP-binding protein